MPESQIDLLVEAEVIAIQIQKDAGTFALRVQSPWLGREMLIELRGVVEIFGTDLLLVNIIYRIASTRALTEAGLLETLSDGESFTEAASAYFSERLSFPRFMNRCLQERRTFVEIESVCGMRLFAVCDGIWIDGVEHNPGHSPQRGEQK